MKKQFIFLLILFLSLSANAQISGTLSVCVSSTTLLTGGTTGGTWSSSNPAVATVGSVSGIVTGIAAGTTVINYTTSSGTDAATVTVNPLPAPLIPSIASLCWSGTMTFSSVTPGGVWVSSNPSIATIGSLSGIITGVGQGVATIYYTLGTGCRRTSYASVQSGPPQTIFMCDNLGVGDTLNIPRYAGSCMMPSIVFGLYSSNYSVLQTVSYPYFSDNQVVGMASGTAIISQYNGSTGCLFATKTVTVTPTAQVRPISGPNQVCREDSVTLTNAVSGGTWSSSNPAAATINPGGIVTGVSNGHTIITYSASGKSCVSSVSVLGPTISGPLGLCNGDSVQLRPGNLHPWGCDVIFYSSWWSSSDTNVLSLRRPLSSYAPQNGKLWALSAGTSTITLHDSYSGCSTSRVETVNPTPAYATIAGLADVCVGSTITLTTSVPGGTWTSTTGNTTISGGVVTGVSAGVDTILYSVSNICGSATIRHVVTINPLPFSGLLSGPGLVCVGTPVTLVSSVPGGVWSASNPHATVSGGIVSGVSPGMDTIYYALSNVCGTHTVSKEVTVNATPMAGILAGPSMVCVGSAITLTATTPGGLWSSSNSSATVASGIVTGVYAGIDTISYTVSNVCGSDVSHITVTVNPLPHGGVLSGPGLVCTGTPVTLVSSVSGGIWSASNPHATVSGGIITGVSPGMDTIYYAVSNICGTHTVSKVVTVNTTPTAATISGPDAVCAGATITKTASVSGGVWSSYNPSIASVDAASGIVAGVATGTVVLSYTLSNVCGMATTLDTINVNPLPDAGTVTGSGAVCVGETVVLAATISGGAWARSNATATVSGGVVTGVSSGVDTISYSVSNICGTAVVIKVVTINSLPSAYMVMGGGSYCLGDTGVHIDMIYSQTGVNYQLYNGGMPTGSAVPGAATGIDLGLFTAPGVYTVVGTNAGTGCKNNMSGSVAINVVTPSIPAVGITAMPGTHIVVGITDTFTAVVSGGGISPSYQWYINSILVPGATSPTYITSALFSGDTVSCRVTSDDICGAIGSGYVVISLIETGIRVVNKERQFIVFPNPSDGAFTVNVLQLSDEDIEVVLTDIAGKKIETVKSSTNRDIHFKVDLPSGVYFINAISPEWTKSEKIVLRKR